MITVNPYLNFAGKTEEAMNFYKSVFGGEFALVQRFRDIPGYEKMPENEWDKIMHMSLPVGKSTTIMATDTLESMGQKLTEGNNFYLCIHTESKAETDRLFEALQKGGKTEMAPNQTFWGAYFGMCRDRFGIQWMLSYDEVKK